MAYDADLTPLLRACSNEELDPLVACVLSARTNQLEHDGRFKLHRPQHQRYVDALVDDIRRFGGNTLRNGVRGGGPEYVTIVRDVAKKLRVVHGEGESVEQIERSLLIFVLEGAIARMSPADREALSEAFRDEGLKHIDLSGSAPLGMLLAQAGATLSGPMVYRLALIVANHVVRLLAGRGLSMGAAAALTKLVGLASGPVGWALTGAWALIDIAGPAYRVTVPVVLHVALLRQKLALQLERGSVQVGSDGAS